MRQQLDPCHLLPFDKLNSGETTPTPSFECPTNKWNSRIVTFLDTKKHNTFFTSFSLTIAFSCYLCMHPLAHLEDVLMYLSINAMTFFSYFSGDSLNISLAPNHIERTYTPSRVRPEQDPSNWGYPKDAEYRGGFPLRKLKVSSHTRTSWDSEYWGKQFQRDRHSDGKERAWTRLIIILENRKSQHLGGTVG